MYTVDRSTISSTADCQTVRVLDCQCQSIRNTNIAYKGLVLHF